MNSKTFPLYRHSGKFCIHGPVLALIVPILAAFPLGFAYSYLLKWIPFVYLNVLLTVGYGFVFGLLTCWLLKVGKVRNNALAAIFGVWAGLAALYFQWNGHIHSLFEGAPILLMPDQIFSVMKAIYQEGTWGLRSGGNITGIPLAIVWIVEAGIIVGMSAFFPYAMISSVPFCEQTRCWLDEEKIISTFETFTQPAHIEALQARDLSPLSQAKPKLPGASEFGRLTVKYSAKCNEFCTATIANVSVSVDSEGNNKETVDELISEIVLPKSFFEFLEKFENLKAPPPQLADY